MVSQGQTVRSKQFDSSRGRGGRWRRSAAMILVLALFGDTTVIWAQAQPVPMMAAALSAGAPVTTEEPMQTVKLLVGHSTLIDTATAIARVSLTSADVADAVTTSQQQLLVHGKMPGTITMFVWDRAGAIRRYEVVVQRDLARVNEQFKELFPNEKLSVESNGKAIVLSGHASTKEVATRALNVAAGYVDKKEDVVDLLQVGDVAAGNQVLLKVRFAEVGRNAMTELGVSLYSDGYQNTVGRSATDQFAQPSVFNQKNPMLGNSQVFSDFLNLFLFDAKHQLGAVVKALQSKGLFQSLAEPNLVAESGKEASFLAGGEFPVPVVQGSGANLAISVIFKEFGIRLNFTPVINGKRVHLKVRPEVSTLDFNNAVILQGFRIPALSTRRTETELELEDGQTFAIAGLMNNSVSSTLQKIPGIGDIPILGQLFRSKAAQKDQTELVVMITPEILPNTSPGVTDALPRVPEKFLEPLPDKKTLPAPAPAFQPARQGAAAQPPVSPAAAALANLAVTGPASAAAINAALQGAGAAPAAAGAPPAVVPAGGATPATAAARREAEQKQQKQQKELERQQAKHDAEVAAKAAADKKKADEAAKRQAAIDREQQKKAEEAAKRQAALDHEQAKKVAAAEAKVKAAEAEYQAALGAKASKEQ